MHTLQILTPLFFLLHENFVNGAFGASIEQQVYALDERIHFDPPLIDNSVWNVTSVTSSSTGGLIPKVETTSSNAAASFTFQGSTIALHGLSIPNFSGLSFNLDGDIFSTNSILGADTGVDTLKFRIGVDLDPTINHTILIRKSTGSADDEPWNLVCFHFLSVESDDVLSTIPPSIILSSSLSAESTSTASSTPISAQPSTGPTTTSQHRHIRIIVGAVAGAVIGVCLVIATIILIRLCKRRRRRLDSFHTNPSPYVGQRRSHRLVNFRWIQIKPRPFSSGRESNNATIGSGEGSFRSNQNSFVRMDNGGSRAVMSSRGHTSQISQTGISFLSGDPFRDPENSSLDRDKPRIEEQKAELPRNSTLPSIGPPPSYCTVESRV